jgi:uncharacterized repeat protein (TIGR04076 family)
MDERKYLQRFGERVGYTEREMDEIPDGDPRLRQIAKLTRAAARYSIQAEVVSARHCNSGYKQGDKFILDVDGNFVTKLCPSRLCVYLMAQMQIPVALINERLSEGLDPNLIHFMKYVRCPDAGVECAGYGEVMVEVSVIPRVKPKA